MKDARIFDPINFLGWLLYCMRDDRTNWLSSLSAVLRGYGSIINITPDEIDSVFFMLYSLGLYGIAAFLKTDIDYTVLNSIDALNWIIDNRKSIDLNLPAV